LPVEREFNMARLKRLYAPFFKKSKDDKKWIRATWNDGDLKPAYKKEQAVRIYQNWLLAPYLDGVDEIRELRPIPVKSKEYSTNLDWQD
jgi:hypothetical protein